MRFIGITGGVGAGKTEILKYIGQHYKCEIYLADDIGHKVKEIEKNKAFQFGLIGAFMVISFLLLIKLNNYLANYKK